MGQVIVAFLLLLLPGPDLGGGGNQGGCPGPTAFEGAPMVLIIMIFMFFWFIVTRTNLR